MVGNKFQLQHESLMLTGSNPENYEEQQGVQGYGVRKKEGECIHEFGAAINTVLEETS